MNGDKRGISHTIYPGSNGGFDGRGAATTCTYPGEGGEFSGGLNREFLLTVELDKKIMKE